MTINAYHPSVTPCPVTGCWLWLGTHTNGYGLASRNGKQHPVHRLSWEDNVGPIPEGMVVDHMCRVRACCNPDHLRVVTQRTNSTENTIASIAMRFWGNGTSCDVCGGKLYPDYDVPASRPACPACAARFAVNEWGFIQRVLRNERLIDLRRRLRAAEAGVVMAVAERDKLQRQVAEYTNAS